MLGRARVKYRFIGLLVAVLALASSLALAPAAPASEVAFDPSPWWHVGSGARPSALTPGGEGEIVVTAENLGDAATVIQHASVSAT
ncbi:MAG: hypothetical protein ACRDK4_02275, partial [Solirubrobacteraceae bacterium]